MDSKPVTQSWTMWLNLILPILYILVPGLKETLTVEVAVSLLGAINLIIRYFKTEKSLSGLF